MAAFGIHTQRDFKKENKMSEQNEKHTSELSMEELDNVAGGATYNNVKGIYEPVRPHPAPSSTAAPVASSGAAADER